MGMAKCKVNFSMVDVTVATRDKWAVHEWTSR